MAEKKLTLDQALGDINKKWGDSVVHKGTSVGDYKSIPFTSPRLNYITHGGLPMGRLIEFNGEEHSGKTTSALDIVANYQVMEGAKSVLWIDTEYSLDEVWATKLGVDVDDMLIMNPDTQGAESIFDDTLKIMGTGEVGLVVIDSFGTMQSDKAYDESVADKNYGGISQGLTAFAKKAIVQCRMNDCTVIGINQLREKLNSTYGGTTTVGGRGWKHDISVCLSFRKGYSFDEKYNKVSKDMENPYGNIVDVAMTKNRTCPPNRRNGFYTLRYDIGIDYLYDLTQVLLKYGMIEPSGSWFSLKDVETGDEVKKLQGLPNVSKFLGDEANVEILKMYEGYIDKKVRED